jgi:uncharacterized protein (DUF58 family)
MSLRPTRRGVAVLAVIVVAAVLAALAGRRALNAVAAPLLAALVAGLVLVVRAPLPTVTYGPLRSGYVGESRRLSVEIEGSGLVRLALELPSGLDGDAVRTVVSPPATVEREVTLGGRGVYRLDPPTVRQRDPLGLVERRIAAETAREFVVYPQVYSLAEASLAGLLADESAAERGEFDRLREYTPGDPLRNVHWKTSAKRDGFYVMEFAPTNRSGTVTVAAGAAEGYAGEMATAAATLAVGALDLGFEVGLAVPGGTLAADRGDAHREALLCLLARTGHGDLDGATRAEAEVSITADAEGTRVSFADRDRTFEAVVGSAESGPQAEVAQ